MVVLSSLLLGGLAFTAPNNMKRSVEELERGMGMSMQHVDNQNVDEYQPQVEMSELERSFRDQRFVPMAGPQGFGMLSDIPRYAQTRLPEGAQRSEPEVQPQVELADGSFVLTEEFDE